MPSASKARRPRGLTRPKSRESRGRILDAAESLFAQYGARGLSMRAITSRAGINVAGVHYYFGSKEGLVLEMVRRRFEPINARRIELLETAIADASPDPPRLEKIVDAFIEPMLRFEEVVPAKQADTVRRFLGRIVFLPPQVTESAYEKLFESVVNRFHTALQSTLPDLDACEIFWRMHLSAGPLLRVLVQGHILPRMSGGMCRQEPIEQVQAKVCSFICAGLRASATIPAESENREISASNVHDAV